MPLTPAGIRCPGGGPKRLGLTCLSLIGLIGVSGKPFDVGDSLTFTAPTAGEVFLGVNDDNLSDNTGTWTATISSPIAFVQWAQAPRVRQELLALQQAQQRNQPGISPGMMLLGGIGALLLQAIGGSAGESDDADDVHRREQDREVEHIQRINACRYGGDKSACIDVLEIDRSPIRSRLNKTIPNRFGALTSRCDSAKAISPNTP